MSNKILYFECKTGAAGDMLMGALYSLLSEEDKKTFLEKMNSVKEGVVITPEDYQVSGIGGTHMHVLVHGEEECVDDHHHHEHEHEHEHHHHDHEHEHEHHHHDHEHEHHHHHHHTSYQEVLELIEKLDFPEEVCNNAAKIYRIIGEAESYVHRTSIEQIHFHELGTIDALIDVVGCCYAISLIQPDHIVTSPVCVGNGRVHCAHGILPVPAPATAEIIKGMPVFSSTFDGELLTPTGAAVLKYFTQDYKKQVEMSIECVGYGMGTKTFAEPTFVRAFLGTAFDL